MLTEISTAKVKVNKIAGLRPVFVKKAQGIYFISIVTDLRVVASRVRR